MFEKFEDAKGIIFDCDGCLLDSMGTWRSVEYKLIELTGREWTEADMEEIRGGSMSHTAQVFHERYGVMESDQAVLDFVHETMWDYYTAKATLKPGVGEFVERVHALGVPMAIVSSTAGKYLRAGLAHVGLLDELSAIVSTQESGLSKQQPDIYLAALRALGVEDPSEAWGFDDSIYAIRVMKQTGLSTVGTYDADDAGTFEVLSDTATLAVRSFEELLV